MKVYAPNQKENDIGIKGYKHGTRKKEFICQQCGIAVVRHVSRNMKFCSKLCVARSGVFGHRVLHSEETKRRISEKKKLNPTGYKTGHPFYRGGEKGWFKKGQKPWNWAGGIRSLSQIIKDDVRWVKWRRDVFNRDNYTCQNCWIRGVELHPHHIKGKVKFPELAFEISNGITLCVPCHQLTDNYGGKKQ